MNFLKKIIISTVMVSIMSGASFVYAEAPEVVPTIQTRYNNGESIKILLVPGHDNSFSGAKFKKEREADMTLVMAKKLSAYLSKDPQLVVVVAREEKDYIKSLRDYFDGQTLIVNAFIKSHAAVMKKEIAAGKIVIPPQVPHGTTSKIPLYRLYAINKWAPENDFDLVIHIHFNDEGDRALNTPGNYSGYSVYVPDSNLLGADVSRDLGTAIAKRLKYHFKPSTMSYEKARSDEYGVISDIKLIALGANKTIAIPRVLIEYAYIYESIVSPKKFPSTSDVMVSATDAGIHDFLKELEKEF